MEIIRFDPDRDLAPIPFTPAFCRKAAELKEAGLQWKPHVGCFVWDRDGHIEVPSPFPERIYFVLSMQRFLQIFGTPEEMVRKLVWLPTWHQTRLLLDGHRGGGELKTDRPRAAGASDTEAECLALYDLLLTTLRESRA